MFDSKSNSIEKRLQCAFCGALQPLLQFDISDDRQDSSAAISISYEIQKRFSNQKTYKHSHIMIICRLVRKWAFEFFFLFMQITIFSSQIIIHE